MNAADLLEAHRMRGILSDEAREVAKTLASRLRATGLVATLAWLRDARKNEGKRQLGEVLSARFGDGLEQLDSPTLMGRHREALRVAEALHVVLRDRTGEP